jgi:fructose-specific phosphotransferase system IIC component
MIESIIVWTVLIVLVAALLMSIINKKMSSSGNFAATSVLADMQNQEKRNAMETVIEEKAGTKRFGQTNDGTV